MSALILLAVVLVLVAIAAPLFRRGLRPTRTITYTIRPDASAALRAFVTTMATAQQAAERMAASMAQLTKDANQ